MSNERETLKKKLDTTLNLLFYLFNLRVHMTSIFKKEATYYERVVNNSPFFQQVFWNSKRLFVIELMKLISEKENEDFSLFKTINYINCNQKKISWHEKFHNGELEKLKDSMRLDKDKYDNLKKLRDKHYAHTDKKIFQEDYIAPRIPVEDLLNYLENVCAVYVDLWIHLNGNQEKANEQFDTFCLLREGAGYIHELYELHKYYLISNLYYREINKKGPLNPLLKEIRKIIRS